MSILKHCQEQHSISYCPGYTADIVPARNGEPTLRVISQSGKTVYLHSCYNPSQEAERKIKILSLKNDEPILLVGLGLGYELESLLERSATAQEIFVIEQSKELFDAVNRSQRGKRLIAHKRVKCIINPSSEYISNILNPLSFSKTNIILQSALLSEMTHYEPIFRILKSYTVKGYNVVIFVGRGIVSPFIVQDICMALYQLGCHVRFLPLRKNQQEFKTLIMNFKPDFILALDANGLEFPWVQEIQCPKVAWFVDNPLYFLDKIHKEDILCCWDEEYIPALKKLGCSRVYHLPLATNTSIFKPIKLTEKDLATYSCEVSFVGTISKNRAAVREERANHFTPEVNVLIDDLISLREKALDWDYQREYSQMTNSVYKKFDLAQQIMIEQKIDYETDAILREKIIKELTIFKTLLFGNAELEQFTTETCRYCGRIDYHQELPLLYNAAAINVNVTRPQLRSTVNQRIFDVAATRSFVLTDYRPFIKDMFSFDPNMICYKNMDDLRGKIKYYLKNVSEREEIAAEMLITIINKHSYRTRMESLLEFISPFC